MVQAVPITGLGARHAHRQQPSGGLFERTLGRHFVLLRIVFEMSGGFGVWQSVFRYLLNRGRHWGQQELQKFSRGRVSNSHSTKYTKGDKPGLGLVGQRRNRYPI